MYNDDLLARWPKNADGEPEPPALLRLEADFSSYRDIVCSMLDSFEIPYFTNRPGIGDLLFIRGGFSPEGIEIYVPASRLEETTSLLNTAGEPAEEDIEQNEEEDSL